MLPIVKKNTKGKSSHHTMESTHRSKIVPYGLGEFSWREKPYTADHGDRLSDELLRWIVEDKEALLLEEFLAYKCMSYDLYEKLRNRSERLQAAHEHAMMVIGIRREKGGLHNKLNAGLVAQYQHVYTRTAKQAMVEKEKAKAQQETQSPVINVIMPDFGEDKRVPVKLIKKEDINES